MRITPKDVDQAIRDARFEVYDQRLTVCVLTLQNGFLVTGESSCIDPAEFDRAKGRAYALEDARGKVSMLLGYAARELTPRPVPETVADLAAAFKRDPAFAWAWHCNIAMAFTDSAIDCFMNHDAARVSYVANEGAARFMKQAFDVQGYGPDAMKGRPTTGGPIRTRAQEIERARDIPESLLTRAQEIERDAARATGVDWSKVNAPPAVTACILNNGCLKAPACSRGCEALPKTRNG